ncbi:TPA: hypothetical protein ACH3X2_004423 [Trebouxia sp. C0005]
MTASLMHHCLHQPLLAGPRHSLLRQCTPNSTSLTSLQWWHTAKQLHPRQKIKACSSKRGRDPFFNDDFFQSGKDNVNAAKDLFAEGEKLFKKGDFQQGQRLFQQAEQQLRQAKQQMPMQPFKSGNMDFRIPKIEVGGSQPSWKTSSLALFGVGAVATLVAGPIIATFLALAVGLGALISTSLAVMSFVWVIPAAAVLLSLGGLFVFPAVLTLALTATGLGIGAAAVAGFKAFIPKQTTRIYPDAAEAVATEPVPETEEQKQQRQYEEESQKLANELREFDAQLEINEKDAYRQKLKQEGLWKE